jgi:FixJ family two-component response regulator
VETHRAAVMARTNSESLPDLIRLVMRAGDL